MGPLPFAGGRFVFNEGTWQKSPESVNKGFLYRSDRDRRVQPAVEPADLGGQARPPLKGGKFSCGVESSEETRGIEVDGD